MGVLDFEIECVLARVLWETALMKGCCYSLVAKLCLTLMRPMDSSPPGYLSMGFPPQKYWIELPLPSPGDLPNPGMESVSSALAGMFFTTEPPGKVKESELLYRVRPGHLQQTWSQGFSWLCEFLQVRFSVCLPTPFSFLHKKQ